MPIEPTKAKTKKTTKKKAIRRRKKTATATERSKSEDVDSRSTAVDESESATAITQIDVGDVTATTRKRSGRTAASSSKTVENSATPTVKRKTTRRRKKKKTAAPTVEAVDREGETPPDGFGESVGRESHDADVTGPLDDLKPVEHPEPNGAAPIIEATNKDDHGTGDVGEPRRRTRRGRRGGRRSATSSRTGSEAPTGFADPDTTNTDDSRSITGVHTSSTADDRDDVPRSRDEQETTKTAEQERERPRRRRGRRGGRGSRSSVPDSSDGVSVVEQPRAAAHAPEPDDTIVEETPVAIAVGDVTFPKPDLNARCKREMVINVTGTDECRIAVLHEGRLEELFIERASSQSHVGNIYKGRVTNVESSIQAAFVDFGLPKNGFLHISDVQPQYFPDRTTETEDVGRKIPRHHRPPIQKCFRRGQEVMVQIIKEGVGTKGPTLTTYLSIPGRYLVMMPGMNRHGVSRKIEDDEERRKMKDVMNELTFPPGMGFILRTAGLGQSKRELQRDLNYMVRLWKRVVDRVKRLPSPAELNRESDLVTRTIRDVYAADFERLIVDDPLAARKARDFFQIAMPRSKPRIEVYTDPEPLFHRLGIEEEIERINARQVPLPSGGSLVIDSTEALVAIDVNSGRFRVPNDAEETALRVNVEAAEEIARQLLLRDLGGLIVCDFIDMRLDRNKRTVERALRDALKKHKARARILRMSAFGLIEMTRQRQGPSLKRNIYFDCPQCRGSGLVKMPESVILDVMRLIQLAAYHQDVRKIRITVSTEVAYQILNIKRTAISAIESATGKKVTVRGDLSFTSDQVECLYEDDRGQPIVMAGVDTTPTHRRFGAKR